MVRVSMMAAVAAITLSTAMAHAQSASTPSLGEVARQTAAKRATGKPATRVYTNASLAVVPEDAVTTAPSAAQAPAAATTAPATPAADAAAATTTDDKATADSISKDENHWRNQAATLRADLARARATLDKSKDGTPQFEQAQRSLAFFQKRWDALVQAAAAAKVPAEWLEARQR